MNESENTTSQNLWATANAAPRGNFAALSVYVREGKSLKWISRAPTSMVKESTTNRKRKENANKRKDTNKIGTEKW